ncbi:MAG: hypothetical protein R3D33_00440 [Hyphomicrobiaceae bacterium]
MSRTIHVPRRLLGLDDIEERDQPSVRRARWRHRRAHLHLGAPVDNDEEFPVVAGGKYLRFLRSGIVRPAM